MAEQPRYFRVGPSIWLEPWDDDTRYVAFYILTSSHRRTEGLFRMPLAYAMADLHWPAERFQHAFDRLVETGFIEYDEASSVCLIVKALQWQAPENPNQVTSAIKKLEELPPSTLFGRFMLLAREHCARLSDALAERFPERLPEPLAQASEEPSRERSGERIPQSQAPTPSRTQAPEQPLPAGADPRSPDLPKVSYGGKRVPAETVAAAAGLLIVFNEAAGRKLGAVAGDGKASPALKQIVGALQARPEVAAADWERAIRRTIATPPSWAEDRELQLGDIFGARAADWALAKTHGKPKAPTERAAREAEDLAALERLAGGAA